MLQRHTCLSFHFIYKCFVLLKGQKFKYETNIINTMKGLIIIDFNRTLYDPDRKCLFEGVLDFLDAYSKNYALAIVGKGDEKRKELINSLNIKHFFKYIKINPEKEPDDFTKCMKEMNFNAEQTWSIGDRIKKDIVFSNQKGIKTIWFKNGKFADEIPESKIEEPHFTVSLFEEIKKIISL